MRTVATSDTNPASSLRAATPRGNPERDAHNPATYFSKKLIDTPQTPFILIPPFHITGAGATNVRGGEEPGSLGVASGKAKTVPRPACPRWQVYRGNPAGMGPSAVKSTGHAKNPGCMRRCMSHLFITQTGHAPSHAARFINTVGLWPDGGFGVRAILRTTTIPAPPQSSSPRRRGSSAPRRRCGRQFMRAGLPAAGFPPARE